MINVALLAYLMVVTVPINWYLEVRADRIAARTVGKASVVLALLGFVNKDNFSEPSEDHPAVFERIKLILKCKPLQSR